MNPLIHVQSKITPHLSHADYQRMYAESLENPDAFWAEQAKRLEWFAPFHTVKNTSFNGDISIRWFEGGKLNVSYNCLDRHLATRGDKVAIIWEGDDPADSRKITYKELHADVCRFANLLKSRGVKKGDYVTIYLPMIPEAAIAMLACTRIGAVHSVVFGGFSPEALKGRIEDCGSKLVITTQEGRRGGKKVPLSANVREAVRTLQLVEVLVVEEALLAQNATDCPAEPMDSEDSLFILYTSGSTGKPKGILHTTAGYLLYAATTFHYVFDYHEGEVFWCTADVGWVTGHSYVLYGALACGATTLMFEGVPNYPDYSRFWQVVDKHQVNIFYTAPTAIRALMKQGDEWVLNSSRKSLRLLGSVGEPINPEAWLWYYEVVGDKRCPIVDTWWQTETGGHLITPLAGTGSYKPGSAMQPFFGIKPVLISTDGKEHPSEGALCIADSWPGQARSIWGDHARFVQTYFSQYTHPSSLRGGNADEAIQSGTGLLRSARNDREKLYFSGDGAQRDADGHYWITGRMDDVLNVSGHRIGTAEVESALVGHNGVAEAAVVGFPHDIKGQGIYAYVILHEGMQESAELVAALKAQVVKEIGAIARPDVITVTRDLPKTRSGKIMRRILRKIAEGVHDFGDVSTLLNPEIAEELWQKHLAQSA